MTASALRWLAAATALTLLAACDLAPDDPALTAAAPADEGLAEPWVVDSTTSPTGTFLLPGDRPGGYSVVDEACGGDVLAPDYADRFLTPMFRDVAVSGDLAWLVDGSHLWTLDVSDDAAPERVGLHAIEGHPIALHLVGQRLWIATIDAGLRGYALLPSGLVDLTDVQVLLAEPVGQVMDVDGSDDLLAVALGQAGVAAVLVDPVSGDASEYLVTEAGPFAVGVKVDGDRVVTAACDRLWSHTWATGDRGPALLGVGLDLEASVPLPFGQAKNVEVVGDVAYVAAGETMQAFRLDEPASWLGYYYADEPGFYVNEIVAGDGVVYLAAGDQSVRALDVEGVPLAEGTPITWDEPGATLDGPIETTVPAGSVHEIPKDPIAIDLDGDRLLVLGNFRYLGERTLEVVDVSIPTWLQPVGAYVQPNVAALVSRLGDALVVHGLDGAHRVVDLASDSPAVTSSFDYDAPLADARVTGNELYLVPAQGAVVRADTHSAAFAVEAVTPDDLAGRSVAADGQGRVFVSDVLSDAILTLDAEHAAVTAVATAPDAFLGDAALATAAELLWAYDRVLGQILLFDASGAEPTLAGRHQVGGCEAYDLADFYAGAVNAQAAFVETPDGLALLCPHDPQGATRLLHLAVDADGAPMVTDTLELPGATWAGATVDGDTVALVGFDNNRYETTVVSLDAASGAIRGTLRFSGRGNAVALDGDRLLVLDGDHGLWSLDAWSLTPLEAAPLPL